ncbi:MAG TPA: D-alanine--D-alanine ligase [Candidatus Fusicatenibacter intestinipullorum]|nr:D-alanine--D-alanine ligase [Candidatus Fusicatenibacter intestinipullorum]
MFNKNQVVAVVMGGPSAEREVSLNTGAAIANALREYGYTNVVEIDLDPRNFGKQLAESKAEVVFNAVHGLYGEDGRLQTLLEIREMPYTGSGMIASVSCMDKVITKRMLRDAGISTPACLIVNKKESGIKEKIMQRFSLPVVIKPASQGSSIGVEIVKEEKQLDEALANAFKYSRDILVEEFIGGKELTVSMMQKDGEVVALPVIHIAPHSGMYDYHSKYTKGATEYICPADLDEETTKKVQEISKQAYEVLGCSGVARADVMLDEEGNGYVLEINTVPGMTATSLVPKAAAAAGISFPELCNIILQSASVNNK